MKHIMTLLVLLALLISCSPSPEAIQEALSQTQTSQPAPTKEFTPTFEPTPTKVPLEGLDLSEIIFQPYELPAGYSPSQIDSINPEKIKEMFGFEPINWIWQDLEYKGEKGGYVTIYIFSIPDEAKIMYETYEDIFKDIENMAPDVGEKSVGVHAALTESSSIHFIRCNAFVSVVLTISPSISNFSDMVNYAMSLDARLAELVCINK